MHKNTKTVLSFIFLMTFWHISVSMALTASEVTEPFDRPQLAPAASDVTIRSLNFRPMNQRDKHDTLKAMQDFHATRLEWVYLRFNDEEKKLIQKVKRLGRVFGATGQSATGVVVETSPGREYIANSMLNISGEPIYLPHTKHWKIPLYPGCVNNPVYKKRNLHYYEKNIDYGAEVIQRDDPSSQYRFAEDGTGCFCKYCIKSFKEYLKRVMSKAEIQKFILSDDLNQFDYRTWLKENDYIRSNRMVENPLKKDFVRFQSESAVKFYKDIRTAVNIYAREVVPFSCNNTSFQRWEEPFYKEFDFAISELMMKSACPVHIYDRSQKARSLGKIQVFGSPKTLGKDYTKDYLISLKRKVIATSYAVGGLSRVPWDIFQQTKDGKGRYFGKPANFADLYAFVRASHKYLSGYQDAGAFGGQGFDEKRYGSNLPIKIKSDDGNIYAFIRAIPKDAKAPVIIHLIDWNNKQEPFEVELNNINFFKKSLLKSKLLVPIDYNQKLHHNAEVKAIAALGIGEKLTGKQADAFSELSKEISLNPKQNDGITKVKVPALNPWGILVITNQ